MTPMGALIPCPSNRALHYFLAICYPSAFFLIKDLDAFEAQRGVRRLSRIICIRIADQLRRSWTEICADSSFRIKLIPRGKSYPADSTKQISSRFLKCIPSSGFHRDIIEQGSRSSCCCPCRSAPVRAVVVLTAFPCQVEVDSEDAMPVAENLYVPPTVTADYRISNSYQIIMPYNWLSNIQLSRCAKRIAK